jgi:RNA polymerase sigma factor (sigma-70 family)
VFEAALSGLGRFRLKSQPLTWLYAIATRHCLKRLRDRHSHQLKEVLIVEPASHRPDLEGRADLERALATLDLSELELFTHAFVDGLTQEEISALTRQSRKTVGKKLNALAARLQLKLEPEAPAAPKLERAAS